MTNMIKVAIEDANNDDGEYWEHFLPVSTDIGDLAKAVKTLYPTWIRMEFTEVEVDEGEEVDSS